MIQGNIHNAQRGLPSGTVGPDDGSNGGDNKIRTCRGNTNNSFVTEETPSSATDNMIENNGLACCCCWNWHVAAAAEVECPSRKTENCVLLKNQVKISEY